MTVETVWLVPHTHWDREWYEPFQRFRLRLVDLMDDVVARAEADPSFHFTLDGQLAVVDDYLEVRPEALPRIVKLVASGQFAIGPWAILLDEFLCSGENIVRNLEWGLRRASELGQAMPAGYLPDMFGHCAQMPQILVRAGIRQACVWRGVPSTIDKHAFRWEAPDGSAIRTEYLPGGYGNAASLLAEPDRLGEAAAEHVAHARPWFGADPILAMYGTDHSAPLPWLSSAVAQLGGALRLSTLAQYLALFDPSDVDALPVWRGELRSHARANILPGVLSNRPHLKRGLAAAERMVERYAEPLAALWSPPDEWPGRLLELAWQRLVQSSCHDSVTGCGVDETAVQVAARIAEAEQIGTGVRDRAVGAIAAHVPASAVLAVNPTPAWRTDVVPVELAAPHEWAEVALRLPDGTLAPFQETGRNEGATLFEATRPASWLAAGLRKGGLGLEFLGRQVQDVAITGEAELTVTMGRAGPGFTAAFRSLSSFLGTGEQWRMVVKEEPIRHGFAAIPVGPLGFRATEAVAATAPPAHPVHAETVSLSNGLLTVQVAADGTLTLSSVDGTVLEGVGRLVDEDDVGDLYNFAPGGNQSGEPVRVAVTTRETGPLVAAFEVTRDYAWRELCTVTMRVELRAGEPFCRLGLTFVNRHPDHRLRLHIPLSRRTGGSHAEGQFAVVARGLTAEGGHGEVPLPTFPAYSFVDSGGAAVILSQPTEYEIVNEGKEITLTLLRATGLISRAEHPLRAEPAGPVIATPQAQLVGAEIRTSLAVMPHAGGWPDVLPAAEAFRHPFATARGLAEQGEISAADGISVTGEGVTMTSLRRRDPDWLELRVVAMTGSPTVAYVGNIVQARRADLLGNPAAEYAVAGSTLAVPLNPWEIATIQLRPNGPSARLW
jgi:mannosylglycerate hydrolase